MSPWKAFGVLLVLLAVGTFFNDRRINAERISDEIGICERVKADRVWNAKAWTQATETWTQRAKDLDLTAAERQLAHDTAVTYSESANQLRSRLFECRPLIEDDRQIIDQPAWREAKGEL